jgi:hypothetical protein
MSLDFNALDAGSWSAHQLGGDPHRIGVCECQFLRAQLVLDGERALADAPQGPP